MQQLTQLRNSTATDRNSTQKTAPTLQVVRLPGECGPVLRCFGDLCQSTLAPLRRDVEFLLSVARPLLTIDLSACRSLDLEGILLLLDTEKRLRQRGNQLQVVSGSGPAAWALTTLCLGNLISVFPTLDSALLAARGSGPASLPPGGWETARGETLTRWQVLLKLLDRVAPWEMANALLAEFPLCERAEAEAAGNADTIDVRCRVCPLFHRLGGRPMDLGCRSALDPILRFLAAGDRESTRRQVEQLISIIQTMPVTPP